MSFYNRAGEPISLSAWAAERTSRIVNQTDLPWGGLLSTVFIGIDLRTWGDGPPLVFETMLFDQHQHSLACRRYATEAEAVAGHLDMLKSYFDNEPQGEE